MTYNPNDPHIRDSLLDCGIPKHYHKETLSSHPNFKEVAEWCVDSAGINTHIARGEGLTLCGKEDAVKALYLVARACVFSHRDVAVCNTTALTRKIAHAYEEEFIEHLNKDALFLIGFLRKNDSQDCPIAYKDRQALGDLLIERHMMQRPVFVQVDILDYALMEKWWGYETMSLIKTNNQSIVITPSSKGANR